MNHLLRLLLSELSLMIQNLICGGKQWMGDGGEPAHIPLHRGQECWDTHWHDCDLHTGMTVTYTQTLPSV